MTRIPFDESFEPPAPVLPVHIGSISKDGPAAMLRMLVDTGADCTLIPVRIARSLRLPLVDRVAVEGVGSKAQPAPVYAARVRVDNVRTTARLVAFGTEALLGRDLLNRLSLQIDGPARVITTVGRAKRTRR